MRRQSPLAEDGQMAKQSQAGKQNKPLLKLIDKYYADLADFARQHVMFEMGTRHAFHRLMADAGKPHGWTLIAEQEKKVDGKTIRPDGTFKDEMNLVRGYWEAKDTADKLDAEIEKKRKAGYPLNNIIFEDTPDRGPLPARPAHPDRGHEGPREAGRAGAPVFPLHRAGNRGVRAGGRRIQGARPRPGQGPEEENRGRPPHQHSVQRAFADFFELCRTSLNPNIAQAAVDEMLIQHILTERLIREIFDNPEFIRRNVIAAEVEKVMLAMTSQSFDRNTYLKRPRPLLRRHRARRPHDDRLVRQAALPQHGLRAVFPGLLGQAGRHDGDRLHAAGDRRFHVRSRWPRCWRRSSARSSASDDVYIIDPCTGTGNFIVNLIRRIPKAKLERRLQAPAVRQ